MRKNKDAPSNQGLAFLQLLKLSLALTAISLLVTYFYDHNWSWFGGLGWWALPLGTVLAGLMFWLPVVVVSHRCLRLPSLYSLIRHLHMLTRYLSWPQIIVLSVLAGLSEELIFRGFLQSWLTDAAGVYIAILGSSLIFALLHAMTLYYFVLALLLSLTFGVLFHLSQSMLLVVTLHAIYDVIALSVIAKYPHYLGSHPSLKSHS